MKTTPAISPAHSCLLIFVVTVASSVYFNFIPFLREFNFDVVRVAETVVKHPKTWGRIFAMICIALVAWRRDYDGDAFDLPGLWLIIFVSLVFGLTEGFLLFLYLREWQKQQPGQSA